MDAKLKKRLWIVAAAVSAVAMLFSCGSRKNNATSRFFNATNSRYNIYYNGKTAFDEALKAQNDGYKENYTEQITMFPVSGIYKDEKTSTGGAFDRAVLKSEKAIKLHSIMEKPPRKAGWQNDPAQVKLQQQEEYNPFLKHCWLLMAKSQYYNGDFLTAAVTFSYIARHYAVEPELVAEARIWQARCYAEMNWPYEVNNTVNKLKEKGIPAKQQGKHDQMYADWMIRSQRYEEAVPYLQKSIKSEKNKKQRSRLRYLLGQIYQTLDKDSLAYITYNKLAKSSPPYEIEFAARIRQTEVFSGNRYEKVIKMLKKMAKSDKNQDFLDQVYYAMGNVYMTRMDTVKAVECYREGIEKSTQNGMDKAICQIRLGDIYFTQKDYINAQPCFSGALAGIRKEYKDYGRVAKLSETLDELVVHYEAVHLQDSLQTLARMPEEERFKAIDKIIAQLIEDEKKAAEETEQENYLANQASAGSNLDRGNTINMPSMPVAGGGDNSFYFYNPQTVAQGKTQFQNKWGKRPLTDDWRRKNKKTTLLQTDENQENIPENVSGDNLSDNTGIPGDSSSISPDTLSSDPKSREYYLQQIPLTEEDMEASNIIVANGLYNMGMIYKDRLEDMNLAVETFEELDRRFPENEYRLEYYYQIYLMALRYKDTELAEKYKNRLIAEFPDSEYAVAAADPNYEYNMRMMGAVQDSIYEATYGRYLTEDTLSVRHNYREFSRKYPLSKLMPKFMFLDALTCVQAGDPEGFRNALTVLTEKYPDADVSELAKEMLKGLISGRTLMQGSFSTIIWNLRLGTGEDGTITAADSGRTFSPEQNIPHRLLLVYATGAIDRNQLLYAVAAYNFANFRVKGFDLNFDNMGNITILTVSGFDNFNEVMDYYRMIYGENGYAPAIDEFVTFFPLSNENYDILMHGKTFEEYMHFFTENHGDNYPALTGRWKIRVETDLLESQKSGADGQEAAETQPAASGKQEPETAENTAASFDENIEEIINRKIDSIRRQETATADREDGREATPTDSIIDPAEEERPKARGENIFRRIFKKVKDTKEYKSIEEGLSTVKQLAGEDSIPSDSAAENKKIPERIDGELTYEQLLEIRKQEAAAKAARDSTDGAAANSAKISRAERIKQQQATRKKLEKEKKKAAKERLRQREAERKEKERAIKKALKEKAAREKQQKRKR
jgi:tetratricopeptide (TPR) repeat protein